jgi:hypothetical protein
MSFMMIYNYCIMFMVFDLEFALDCIHLLEDNTT